MHNSRNVCSPDRITSNYSSYGNHSAPWRSNDVHCNNSGSMSIPPPSVPWMDQQTAMPSNSGRWSVRSNEIDPGMNGDGWQGQGAQQPQRGGGHHMGGGGRRGMHQRMGGGGGGAPQQQQQRMMAPNNYRQQQNGGGGSGGYMPDMMALNIMQMSDLSLNGGPQVMPQPTNGMYGDMPPQPSWPQPQPFGPQDDLYDHVPPFGAPPTHNGGPPYGNNRNGGYNNRGNRQGGYRPPQQPGAFPMSMPPMPPNMAGHPPHPIMPMSQGGGRNGGGSQGGYYQPQQQQFNSQPFPPMGGGPMDPMGGPGGVGGSHGGFAMSGSMDDYSMWTDENDEETKKKKILKDKGLNVWGDAETSNAKPIRRWLIPEGQDEDLETAMSRCPQYLKKKTVHEEALRRRLASDNVQISQQAQQQLDEERNAMMKVGRRPIVACGWGDLPPEMAEKCLDFDPKVWSDDGVSNGGPKGEMPWNLPGSGGPSSQGSQSLETRNPFFAQHMQQQQQTGGIFTVDSVTGSGDGVWSNGSDAVAASEPLDENRMKVAENLRYAVEKGHLDIGLLSLTHIPPTVLDLLTIILTKIPVLDAFQDELTALAQSTRPPEFEPTDDPKLWLTETQTNEYNKMMISVVTAKIEVTDLSKKINQALVNAGLAAPSALTSTSQTVSSSVAVSASASGGGVVGVDSQSHHHRANDTFENAPLPDNCDFYDYSFLG